MADRRKRTWVGALTGVVAALGVMGTSVTALVEAFDRSTEKRAYEVVSEKIAELQDQIEELHSKDHNPEPADSDSDSIMEEPDEGSDSGPVVLITAEPEPIPGPEPEPEPIPQVAAMVVEPEPPPAHRPRPRGHKSRSPMKPMPSWDAVQQKRK